MNETLTTLLAGALYLGALGLTFWWIHRNLSRRDADWEALAQELPADDIGKQPPLAIRRKQQSAEQRNTASI